MRAEQQTGSGKRWDGGVGRTENGQLFPPAEPFYQVQYTGFPSSSSSSTSVTLAMICQATRCHIPEDCNLQCIFLPWDNSIHIYIWRKRSVYHSKPCPNYTSKRKATSILSSYSVLRVRVLHINRSERFRSGVMFGKEQSSAPEYMMLAPTKLLRNWQEEQPSYQGDIDSSVTRKVGTVHYERGSSFRSDICTVESDYCSGCLFKRHNPYMGPYIIILSFIFLDILEIKVYELNSSKYRIY
jgi:hypothetical protein